MPRILFEAGDKHGKYIDLLELPEDGCLMFDGRGGIADPRGKYEPTGRIVVVEGVDSHVWKCVNLLR